MASFPSSWIITPKESGAAQPSPLPPPSPAFEEPPVPPSPRRRERTPRFGPPCECDHRGNHDDIHPLSLRDYPPFQKDYPFWPVFPCGFVPSPLNPDRGAPRSQPHANQTHFQCGPSIMSTLYSTSSRAKEPPPPPPPHPAPHAHYSTHFPSTWRLSMPHTKRRLSATSLVDPQDSPASSRPKLTPQSSSARQLPIRQASRERTPTQQQQQQERTEAAAAAHETAMANATANTAAMSATSQNMADGTSRDLMAELQSEPSQDVDMGVQIGMWVDRVSSHGSFSSQSITATTTTKDTSTALDEERRPSVAVGGGGPDMDVDMDGSDDASGLGDAAHVPRGMLHENYSIYSESTNRVEQGCEG